MALTNKIPLQNDDGKGPYNYSSTEVFDSRYTGWLKASAQSPNSKIVDIHPADILYIGSTTPVDFSAGGTANFGSGGNCEYTFSTLNYYVKAVVYVDKLGAVSCAFGTEGASAGAATQPAAPSTSAISCTVTLHSNGSPGAGEIDNISANFVEDQRALLGGAGGGSGTSGETNFETIGTAEDALLTDFTTGKSAIFADSGTITGTFEITETAADLIRGDKSFKYTIGAVNDWVSREIDIPQGYRGRELNLSFQYKYNGDNDDMQLVVRDITNSNNLIVHELNAFSNTDNTATEYRISFTCPSDCEQIKYGFQTLVANSAKVFIWDDVVINGNVQQFDVNTVSTNTVSTASSGTWDTGITGNPEVECYFWDNSASKFDLLSAPSYSISTDSSGAQVDYDFTPLTFDTSDYVLMIARYGHFVATPSKEYESSWITVSAINDTLKGASVAGYHEITLPNGFTDYPAGVTVLRNDGTNIFPADYASVVVFSKSSTLKVRVAVDTNGWSASDQFKIFASKSARPVGYSEFQDSRFLANNQLLEETDFSGGTTNLYGNHFAGTTDFDGSAWIGGEALTEVGSVASAANHLGNTTYCSFTGTQVAYYGGTAFDTSDESFTTGGWFYVNSFSGTDGLINKYTAAQTSFQVFNSSNDLSFGVHYSNGPANRITINGKDVISDITGKWAHLAFVYDQANTSITMYVNGKIRAHTVDALLTNRYNNAATKLTVMGYDGGGSPFSRLNGRVSDFFYQKSAMTFDQIRRAYIAGTQKIANEDQNSAVQIFGEVDSKGHYLYIPANATGLTATSSTAVPDWSLDIPETGYYRIIGRFNARVTDANDNDIATMSTNLYNVTTSDTLAQYEVRASGWTSTGSSSYIDGTQTISERIYATKGDNIILRYSVVSGDSGAVFSGPKFGWEYLGNEA